MLFNRKNVKMRRFSACLAVVVVSLVSGVACTYKRQVDLEPDTSVSQGASKFQGPTLEPVVAKTSKALRENEFELKSKTDTKKATVALEEGVDELVLFSDDDQDPSRVQKGSFMHLITRTRAPEKSQEPLCSQSISYFLYQGSRSTKKDDESQGIEKGELKAVRASISCSEECLKEKAPAKPVCKQPAVFDYAKNPEVKIRYLIRAKENLLELQFLDAQGNPSDTRTYGFKPRRIEAKTPPAEENPIIPADPKPVK